MGSVSGLTAFSLVFLSLAMLIFWSVTDLGSNQAVQEQMLKFQAKEIANDIELVADYQNEGYAEVALDSNYTFEIKSDADAEHGLSLSLGGVEQTVDLNKRLEGQNTGGGSLSEFSAKTLCIYEDYQSHQIPGTGGLSGVWATTFDTSDVRDPEENDEFNTEPEENDKYVQIYPGACT